jgi:pimeloyl-ACP methyl ester carboxylesterase
MSAVPTDPATDEAVAVLDAANGALVAIVTRSNGPDGGPGVVVCPGGWYGTSTNRNRVFVRLARRLAAGGATVIRFDWHGVGESAGEIDRYVLDEPFTDDVVAAADHLQALGHRDLTLVGVCFGARSALGAAPLVPGLRRLILLSFPVPSPEGLTKASWYGSRHGLRDLLRLSTDRAVLAGLRDPNVRRVYRKAVRLKLRSVRGRNLGRSAVARPKVSSPSLLTPGELLRQLSELERRGVSTHLLFGEEDIELAAFAEFRDDALDRYLASESAGTIVRTVSGNIHGFDTLAVQDAVIDLIAAAVHADGHH